MSNATDVLEAAIGSALFLAQPLVITQWTVHLFSTAPNDAGLNGVEIPAGANGYQPVRHDPGPERWIKGTAQDGSGNTVFRNLVRAISDRRQRLADRRGLWPQESNRPTELSRR